MLKSFLLLMTLLLPRPGEMDPEAVEWFRRGEAMIGTATEYSEEQARCFREALAREPGFNEARYNLIVVLMAMGNYPEAESEASLLIANDPGSLQGLLLRAEARLALERGGEALEDLSVYLEAHPQEARGWEDQGEAYFQSGDFPRAVESYRRAMTLGRQGLSTGINLGLALLNSGQSSEAVECFRDLSTAFPEAWEGYYWKGVALLELGRLAEAVADLEKAEALNPQDDGIREKLITACLAAGDLEKAGARINRKQSKTAEDFASLARLARAEGRMDDALAYLRAAAGMAPDNASILAGYGDIQADLDQTGDAIGTYRLVLEINPEDFTTLLSLGGLLSDRGELEEARGLLERAAALEPGSAEAHFRLALVMDKMEEYGPARKEYEKALDLGSDSLVAHFRLGFFLAEEGNREGAMSHLAAAVTADPKKFVPYLFKEVQKVHSQLDCIRYTEPFTELLNRYREFWIQGKEESPGPDQPIPGEEG